MNADERGSEVWSRSGGVNSISVAPHFRVALWAIQFALPWPASISAARMLAGVGAIKGYPFIIDNHVMLFCTGIAGDGRWMAYHKMRHLRAFIREYLEKN